LARNLGSFVGRGKAVGGFPPSLIHFRTQSTFDERVQLTMAFSVVMPALEMAQETGKLVSWMKKEGDAVAKGEPLLEIETDKAVMEIESPADGILAGVKAQPGAVVPVGQTIAWIVRPGEAPPVESTASAETGRYQSENKQSAVAAEVRRTEPVASTEARISPKARRLAKEHGVDIATLNGSGAEGEILASDILAAAELERAEAAVGSEAPSAIGRLMAERTTQSWTTVPHFFVTRDVDASALLKARELELEKIEKSDAVRVTHTDLLVALIAKALSGHPQLNSSWVDGKVRTNPAVNIGIAMAVDDGVVAPVIPNADKILLAEIAIQRHELSERARSGRLRPADISGGTFTISNLGMFDVDAFTAIISPPQVAILAVGAIAERVIAVNGQPVVRPMMSITLSSDHRVVDGARAAAFLRDVVKNLREPEKWLR
jgi:pyruvate dehydrogenase E2 component (dihydrolipoamide acetyltransferase)